MKTKPHNTKKQHTIKKNAKHTKKHDNTQEILARKTLIALAECVAIITRFIRKQARKKHAKTLIIGLSGGLDSAVVARLSQLAVLKHNAKLAKRANKRARKQLESRSHIKSNSYTESNVLHTESSSQPDSAHHCAATSLEPLRVVCVYMPSLSSSQESLRDATLCAERFELELIHAPITHYHRAFLERFPNATALEAGNFCARMRMATLYHYSSIYKGIVVGTSNKSELLLGYGTIFGDLACAINPIGSLLKTQIFALATYLAIPEQIITKPPSADLYPNQSDEAELGFSYKHIDMLLHDICANARTSTNPFLIPKVALESKLYKAFDSQLIAMVQKRISTNAFKHTMPTILTPKHTAPQTATKSRRKSKPSSLASSLARLSPQNLARLDSALLQANALKLVIDSNPNPKSKESNTTHKRLALQDNTPTKHNKEA